MKKKQKKQQFLRKEKGITLIALVITVIVLLILAGVSITMLTGENGILNQASKSSVKHENASVYEQLLLKVADYQIELTTSNTEAEILTLLKQDGYVHVDNTVNVQNLMGTKLNTGNGSIEDGDVYVLEQRQITASTTETDQTSNLPYYLIYYNENKEETNLGKALEAKEEKFYEPTDESYFEFDEETGGIALKDSNSYYVDKSGIIERVLELDTIVIPSTYNGQTVTRVGIAYYNGDMLLHIMGVNVSDVKKIILPDTITLIEGSSYTGAFQGCTSLEEINLPDSVESIEYNAFKDCTSLSTITIPESVTSMGGYVFEGCTSLQTIYIPFTKEEGLPDGWNSNWNYGCNAQIIYADTQAN